MNEYKMELEFITAHITKRLKPMPKTPKGIMNAINRGLSDYCKAMGMKPETELFLDKPTDNPRMSWAKNCWHVGLEAGPYEWAIYASGSINELIKDTGFYVEPGWSFSLCLSH